MMAMFSLVLMSCNTKTDDNAQDNATQINYDEVLYNIEFPQYGSVHKENIIFNIIAILCISIFCASLAPKVLQNDTFYTIKIGEYKVKWELYSTYKNSAFMTVTVSAHACS